MANSEVKVELAPGLEITLATDNPDIEKLVDAIAEHRDSLDVDSIKVSCEIESFDKESFREVIKTSCEDFLSSIKLERESFNEAISKLRAQEE